MALKAAELPDERAAIYTRISSDDDAKVKQLGVARQEKACRAYVDGRGWKLAGVYCDNNRSASKDKAERPQFDRLLADLGAGSFDRVVVLAQDRLVRKPDELETTMRLLRARGIAGIDTVTDGHVNIGTTTGRTMARVKGVFDIAYAEYISEKVQQKKDELAERGLPSGGGSRPFGFEDDRVTIRKAEARLIRHAARQLLAGESIYSVCEAWQAKGVQTVTGRPWLPNVVRGILLSPRVAGLRQHRGEIVGDAVWPAVLDRETWEQVRALCAAPSRRRRGRPARLLTGLLTCGRCGTPMSAGTNNGKRAYACKAGAGFEGCGKLAVIAEPVEEIIIEAALRITDAAPVGAALGAAATAKGTTDIAATERRLTDLAEMWARGELSNREWSAARKVLDKRLAAARADLDAAAEVAVNPYRDRPGLLRRRWPKLDDEHRRQALAALMEMITVAPAKVRGRHAFDAKRLTVSWRA